MLAVSLLVSSGLLTRTSVSTKSIKGQKVLICERNQVCDFSDLVPQNPHMCKLYLPFFDSSTAKTDPCFSFQVLL